MKREFLSGLGLEKETVDKIMEEYGKDIEQAKSKYSDYDDLKATASKYGELEKALEKSGTQLAEKEKEIEALNGKVKGYESESLKVRLASENGLNYSAVQFLKGDTEEEIKKSVENLKELVGVGKQAPPLAKLNENTGTNKKDTQLKSVLDSLLQKG